MNVANKTAFLSRVSVILYAFVLCSDQDLYKKRQASGLQNWKQLTTCWGFVTMSILTAFPVTVERGRHALRGRRLQRPRPLRVGLAERGEAGWCQGLLAISCVTLAPLSTFTRAHKSVWVNMPLKLISELYSKRRSVQIKIKLFSANRESHMRWFIVA